MIPAVLLLAREPRSGPARQRAPDRRGRPSLAAAFALLALVAACGGEREPSEPGETPAAESPSLPPPGPSGPPEEEEGAAAEAPELAARLLHPSHGDFADMLERRVIRALVVVNKTHFFFDKGRQRGIVSDALQAFEKHLNDKLALGARKLHVVAIPVRRDQLLPYLEEGRGDMAAGNLTITPERLERAAFIPTSPKPVDELIVTGPGAPPLASLDDLSGQRVHVRRSSSFWMSLERLNEGLRARGLAPVEIVPASEYLETEDLLEMVNGGLIPITVADSHIAAFWRDVLPELVVHEDLKVAEGTQIGWAIRRDAPGLKAQVEPWLEANRAGQLLGNMLLKRYLKQNPFVKNATAEAERKRFTDLVDLFRRYGDRYRFDWLMVAAQGYQESGLDQSVRSPVGAIGVMQVMPQTARDPAVGIPDIEKLESNVHAGNKYLRYLIDTYFDDPAIDAENRLLFAFAGYNAGPNRIQRLREQAAAEGLDPARWFGNVEVVVAREVGREPTQYVSNIYKYYIAYRLIADQMAEKEQARKAGS